MTLTRRAFIAATSLALAAGQHADRRKLQHYGHGYRGGY